ncbi:MAG: hypothetical protein HYW48_12120 [Deltaproteobacteria bacterium]|nr:hypothetical protein [Deltaproteobacteria bacterium]
MPVGRYIKKGSHTFDHVTVTPYSFKDISTIELLYSDNPNANIIHTRLHEERSIDKNVSPSDSFNKNLEEKKRTIIFPTDFTKDWEEAKERARHPVGMDDEEEYEMYLEKVAHDAKNQRRKNSTPQEDQSGEGQQEQTLEEEAAEPHRENHADDPVQNSSLEDLQSSHLSQKQPLEIVKDALSRFEAAETHPEKDQGTKEPVPKSEETNDGKEETPETLDRNQLEAMKTAAYTKGIEEGSQKAKKELASLAKQLGEITDAYKGLKKDVLSNIQENFYEIVKALGESLFEREITANPESFGKIIRQAIDATVKDDKFKVMLHPNDFKRISALGIPKWEGKLQEDAGIEEGSFKLETDLGSIESDIKKILTQLLEQTNLNLFDT